MFSTVAKRKPASTIHYHKLERKSCCRCCLGLLRSWNWFFFRKVILPVLKEICMVLQVTTQFESWSSNAEFTFATIIVTYVPYRFVDLVCRKILSHAWYLERFCPHTVELHQRLGKCSVCCLVCIPGHRRQFFWCCCFPSRWTWIEVKLLLRGETGGMPVHNEFMLWWSW